MGEAFEEEGRRDGSAEGAGGEAFEEESGIVRGLPCGFRQVVRETGEAEAGLLAEPAVRRLQQSCELGGGSGC